MAFERILAAVDFSPDSVEAFHFAAEMARLHGASLHVVHVTEAGPVASSLLPTRSIGEMTVEIMAKANAAMETLLASEPAVASLPVTTEVTTGRAVVEIPNCAREWRADAIVLGSKGVASLADVIMGSTAEGVLRTASCSVLVHKPRRQDRRP